MYRATIAKLSTILFAFSFLQLSVVANAAAADNDEAPVAIVTGSSYGLGRELTLLAQKAGMRLVLVDMRPEPSEQLVDEFRASGGDAVFIEADLADPAQRPRVIDGAIEAFGRIDYLFNNAGYSYMATLEQMSLADAHHIFEVNYWAYADLAQRAIAPMRAAGGGTIVNVASILGVSPSPPGLGHYGATKHALLGLFQTAARELEADNIKIIIAAPGGMSTKIAAHATGPLANPDVNGAANWEDPAVAAKDIFDALDGDDLIVYPGYIGQQVGG